MGKGPIMISYREYYYKNNNVYSKWKLVLHNKNKTAGLVAGLTSEGANPFDIIQMWNIYLILKCKFFLNFFKFKDTTLVLQFFLKKFHIFFVK